MEYDDRHTIILIVILNLKLSALHTSGQLGILIINNEIIFSRRRIPARFGLDLSLHKEIHLRSEKFYDCLSIC